MAQRKLPAAEPPAFKHHESPTRVPTAIWVDDKLVCVEIIDPPPLHESTGACRCPACHGAAAVDFAARFYPPE
jgi:hypothetical protein